MTRPIRIDKVRKERMTTEAYRASLPESTIQDAIMGATLRHGWRRVHFRPARTERGWRTAYEGDDGFPDVVAVRGDRIVVIECKAVGKRPTQAQADWLAAFTGTGKAEVYVLTPADLDRVEEMFR
ncbi:MAG: VRR-NUC domain-containing protein [Vicinamibacterales bacterium]